MNKVILMGRLTRDPEDRQTFVKYTIAVDRFNKDKESDFISCVAFGKTADFAKNYLSKGTKVAITGRIQTGSYEKDGRKIYTTDVVVETQEFCESKKKVEETEPEKYVQVDKDDLPPWLQ